MTLTELRIWHWQRVLRASRNMRKYERKDGSVAFIDSKIYAFWREDHKLHMGAVHALNDILHATTAEQDLAERT